MKILLFLLLPIFVVTATAPSSGKPHNVEQIAGLRQSGLNPAAFNCAIRGWEKLRDAGTLANPDILTIIDFSQSSCSKRLYVIDLKQGKLLYRTYVAHGRNTGDEYATHFSNEPSSLKSSLGFYITSQPIMSPKHGLALLIHGLERGINHNAQKREIIIHAADYVSAAFISRTGRLGRSFGCPALPPEENANIIEAIKEGSCLFVYQANPQYLHRSKLLQ